MSKLNIGIAGVGGRMGVMILKDILGREATTVASGLVRTGSNLVGRDLGTLASIEPLGVAITDNPKTCFADADVVVDFSLPEAIEELAEAAIDEKTLGCGNYRTFRKGRGYFTGCKQKNPGSVCVEHEPWC